MILLAVLVSGVGHIYLGIIKRGIFILIIGLVSWYLISWFVPFPLSWVIFGAYWIWQIVDVYRIYKKMGSGQIEITDFKR
jgi:TM2 domain-containing membrane protein YozV